MSGIGRVFKRTYKRDDGSIAESSHYSIEFPHAGKTHREATNATTDSQARLILKRRLDEVGRGSFAPGQDKIYLKDLVELLEAHYRANNRRSLQDVLWKLKAPLSFFANRAVPSIDIRLINAFVKYRRDECGLAISSVNGELRYLRAAFRLGLAQKVIGEAPLVKLLGGENQRDGFINPADFEVFLSKFKDQDVRDLVEWLYWTGWRKKAGQMLEWKSINLERSTVTLTTELSKNKKPLDLPLNSKLSTLLERRLRQRRVDCPLVFHRQGAPIRSFRRSWKAARLAIKRPDLMVHDLCRSAARNLAHAGVREGPASKFMNRSSAMYKL